MVVMAISDVLTLNFFFMVRDEGSWLDIGTSISHFGIASLLCVFVAGLEFVSEVFVSGVAVGGGGGELQEQRQQQSLSAAVVGKPASKANGSTTAVANGVKADGRINPFADTDREDDSPAAVKENGKHL